MEQEQQKNINKYYDRLNPQIYNQEGIDKVIITNASSANHIIRKVPNYIQEPVYYLENGKKVPLRDEEGNIITDENGVVKFAIEGYKTVQDGWIAEAQFCPASEPFSSDMTSSNFTEEETKTITELGWYYDYYQRLQMITGRDYSFELHQLVNDINFIVLPKKSFMGGSVAAVKTFRNIGEDTTRSFVVDEAGKKRGLFTSINETLWGKQGNQAAQQTRQRPFYL